MTKAKKSTDQVVVTAYKGFDAELKCRGFQYAVGKEYTHDGEVAACSGGFHACEHPLAVWTYYGVNQGNRFALVELGGKTDRDGDKLAAQTIKIKAEIGIPGLIKAAIEWTRSKATEATSGDYANSATSGDYANSATSGDYANSATSGYSANSATSGNSANSATSGNSANSATSGYYAHSEAKGKNAIAANAGNGKAKAGVGGAIFIVERDRQLNILSVFASKVGENGIEPDTWYALKNGKPEVVS